MKKQIIYSIIVLLMGLNLQAQVVLSDKNYVHVVAPQTPMTITELENVNCSTINDLDRAIEGITYYDGLGRPIQERAIQASPGGNDIVTHITYDAYGRQAKQYLPFESDKTIGSYQNVDINMDINQYYNSTYANDFIGIDANHNDFNAYSESVYEASPLNRVLEQGAPGKAWKADRTSDTDHTIKFDWDTNVANEVVYFKVNFATPTNTENPGLVKDGYYAAGQLYVTITKDENWTPASGNLHTTKEYKDKQGRVVLKRTFASTSSATGSTGSATPEAHDTYYVYDKYGNLTYVIPPKVTTSDGVSQSELAELCYQYRYDYRNRLIEKKIPGKGWEYIIYNQLDQPIMTQDANLKADNAWLYTKYDTFGRVAYTGKITDARDRATIQTEATAYSDVLWVARIAPVLVDGVQLYYNDGGYPKVNNATLLTINYYDDYTFDIVGLANPGTVYNEAITNQTKTLATGSKVRVLDTYDWITTVTYYDKKARPIYVASKNEYLNTTDIVATQLDFVGKVKETKTTHTKGSNAAIITIDRFTYDHMGRMLTQRQCIEDTSGVNCNGNTGVIPAVTLSQPITQTTTTVAGNTITLSNGFHFAATASTSFFAKIQNEEFPGELIVTNTYDKLGQLISKEVGGGLQDVNYKYNVRGWLKSINQDSYDDNDLFAFTINYNTPQHGATALFNGNISETAWKTANDNVERHYKYGYDALNRITEGISSDGNYNLSGVTYDKTGNILSLNRKGNLNEAATSFGDMDMLAYTYDSGNKLLRVTDTGNTTFGFKDGSNTNDDYTYDANGNMTIDQNKGITGITYNHLNLPKTVTVNNASHTGNITYIYDATGVKLKKITTEGSSLTTEYAGNYVYKNGTLEFFNHTEGIVEHEADGYKYVYQYKDHLGNIRLSYKDADKDGTITTSEIVQEKNYYPFGLQHEGYNFDVNGAKNDHHTYNGKEHSKDLGLNIIEMDWRHYNPTIGRFPSIDPLADHPFQLDLTPYNFA
ncbi:RHS repeat-associated protein, partial [Aquimarina sp. EL_43]